MTFGTEWEQVMGTCAREAAEALFMRYVNAGGEDLAVAGVCECCL